MKIERAKWVVVCCGALAAHFIGCGPDDSKTPLTTNPTTTSSGMGGGGEGGTAGGGMGGTGGMMPPPECVADTDCTNNGPTNYCGKPACQLGKCIRKNMAPIGQVLPSQTYGDCLVQKCDENGDIVAVPDDLDAYNDGLFCTDDVCKDGQLAHTPKTVGSLCNGGNCDGNGQCVQCIEGVQGCQGVGLVCVQGKCLEASCTNGTKSPGEGDIDCGGKCLPCADGKTCTFGSQCASQICMGGLCAAPACPDGFINGNETGFDCGGTDCPKCVDEDTCKLPGDCQSGVCINGICIAPLCTDAVQNGTEAGADCGGPCPPCFP